MFWLAVIFGSLIVLHAFLLIILKFGKRNSETPRTYGALIFPRFEIFLTFLAVPCVCKASAVLIKGNLNPLNKVFHLQFKKKKKKRDELIFFQL